MKEIGRSRTAKPGCWSSSTNRARQVQAAARIEFDLDAELVLPAMGFVHPAHEGLLKMLGVDLDQATSAPTRSTTRPRVPTCSPPAICAAASRSWSGRSGRGGCARRRSTSSSWGRRTCRGEIAVDAALSGATRTPGPRHNLGGVTRWCHVRFAHKATEIVRLRSMSHRANSGQSGGLSNFACV